ncbi:xylan glycosyltransferase MUCI21-like [Amaranthus tricolor]|uniref:xylan glycosyltransferase MUCI21-like n=1 Tax=Amaranthus tricolor TaxID=29722 RepID=UPI002589A666|nr:xylan glycosyltransferase MUCI21-like [Amaranthus tricolor]
MVYLQKFCNYNDHQDHHHMIRNVDQGFQSMMIMKEDLRLIKRVKSKLFSLLCLCFLSCSFIWVSQIFGFPFSVSYILQAENVSCKNSGSPIASSVSNGTLYCDRTHVRTDICYMKGDIRTQSSSSLIFLYNPTTNQDHQEETIKPYTRKWEHNVMNRIDELHLISKPKPLSKFDHKCEVFHDVPGVFFSTGGYTGNVYHEFNDGIIPLYITTQHYNKQVIFVILEYHSWWHTKYAQILAQLSNYPPINFDSNSKTHCFKEAIVGLKIHDELTIDSSLMERGSSKAKSIVGFQELLTRAYTPNNERVTSRHKLRPKGPKMVLLSRGGTRSITNEHALVKLGHKLGFDVQILKPNRKTELGTIYKAISTSDVMVGVHGAAMTHFLFLEPKRVLIQVIPLGTEWASETYYGEPAKKMGLKYIGYKIHPRESSLYSKYDKDDLVLRDPNSVNNKGWEYTKKVYLDDQKVTLDLKRFKKLLVHVYEDYLEQFEDLNKH